MTATRRMGIIAATSVAAILAACLGSPSPSAQPSASTDPTGVLIVQPGEKLQTGPPTEELKQIMSDALVLAQNNGNDLGYPTWDAATGEIVLSVVTPHGSDLIIAAGIRAPYRIRAVKHGVGLLEHIRDDATFLRAQGVSGAELIYATFPDYRDNRAVIVISAPSQPLLDALTARYPADALAVQLKPIGAP